MTNLIDTVKKFEWMPAFKQRQDSQLSIAAYTIAAVLSSPVSTLFAVAAGGTRIVRDVAMYNRERPLALQIDRALVALNAANMLAQGIEAVNAFATPGGKAKVEGCFHLVFAAASAMHVYSQGKHALMGRETLISESEAIKRGYMKPGQP